MKNLITHLKASVIMMVCLMCATSANAYDFEQDSIYYTIYYGGVYVTYKDDSYNSYKGDGVISIADVAEMIDMLLSAEL